MSSSIINVRQKLPVLPFSLPNVEREREHVSRDQAASQADRRQLALISYMQLMWVFLLTIQVKCSKLDWPGICFYREIGTCRFKALEGIGKSVIFFIEVDKVFRRGAKEGMKDLGNGWRMR